MNIKKKILIVEDQFLEANDTRLMLERAGHQVVGIARTVAKAREILKEERVDIVLLDIVLKGPGNGLELAKYLREQDIVFIFVSANLTQDLLNEAKITQPHGFIGKPFREQDLLVTLEIANYRHENNIEALSRKEKNFEEQLDLITHNSSGWQDTLIKVCKAIQPFIPFDYMGAGFKSTTDPIHNILSLLRIGFDEYQVIGIQELMMISDIKADELRRLQLNTKFLPEATIYNGKAFVKLCEEPNMKQLIAESFQVSSHLILPLKLDNGDIFYFLFFSRRPDIYLQEHIDTFARLKRFLKTAVDHIISTEKLAPEKEKPRAVVKKHQATPYAQDFEGIIGNSHLLLNVFDHIKQVAPVNTSVLILGESGTGKERIAECIHSLSDRRNYPLIKVNCAALPDNLVESELFGHERGAFTGAMERRIGKFEQAHRGSIFLDEIGELPMGLQMKLLRVLQEKEIERIGGQGAIKVDIRIIAATNRNLEKEVAEGRFRLDLYYRLNIFPVRLPSLRERKEDIVALVDHFIQYFNRKTGKKIRGVSDHFMSSLMKHSWPGNIRELEHLIERSVLLAKEDILYEPGPVITMSMPNDDRNAQIIKTINDNERDHIMSVLKTCNGKIWGERGAAELLGIPPTTLTSRMKKLGIKKNYFV